MSKGLKGITVKIDGDTKPLNQALSKVNSESKSLQGELKGINSLLKFDPKNTELLAQKQTVLSKAIEQTENKLKLLKQAQQEMAAAGKNADNSAEYRDLQREIVATQQKLVGYNTQLKNMQNSQKEAAKEAETLGQKIYKIASHIPIVNKLADGFVKAKQKITESVKESAGVQKIGSAVEGARQKVEAFKNSHPHVKKVADAFHSMKEKADELKSKLPTLQQSLAAVGNAAAVTAKGGFKALEVTIGGTMKAFAAFSTAAVTAGAAITKSAVESYSEYEQLLGGVETLYGAKAKSAQEYAEMTGSSLEFAQQVFEDYSKREETVLENARNAYKTAGMSTNEYMETVNGFAASLTSSLGQYEWQAANYADMIITDMSDNANKMGTDIESIKNAYAGFAKGNFTMLDNLKLGYGGTKTEMERLLRTAEELEGLDAGSLSIESFADIASAINTVQTEMGITGTTAKEASETIQGSTAAAKSAYENLMTGLADENADLDVLIDNMADSVLTVADNVLPRIMETVPRIVGTVPKLIDGLSAAFAGIAGPLSGLAEQLLPPLMQAFFTLIRTVTGALPTLLPQILNAAVTLFGGLLQGLSETIPQIMAMLSTLIQTISQTLIANLPQLITAGVQILVNLISGITQAIPSLISAIVEMIPVIVQTIMENLPLIIDAGLNLLLSLVSGIVQAIPQLIAMLPTIIDTIVTTLITMLPKIIEAGIQLLDSLISGIIQAIPQLIAALPQIISSMVNTLIANLPKIIQTGIELLGAIISGIIQAIPQLIAALPQVFKAIIDTFKSINWADLGKNIIDGVIKGVKDAANSLIDVFKDLAKSALDAVKKFFGIKSPSTVMRDQVGKMLPAGMAQGVEDGMDEEEARIKAAMARGVPTTIDSYLKVGSIRTGTPDTGEAVGGFTQNLTINSPRELSPSEVARQTRNATRQMILRFKPS